jgi:hypothetical protein
MRPIEDRGTLYAAVRDTHRALASLLLAGAMLTPVVAAVAGWPVNTPLGVPLPAHVAILTVLGGAAAVATVRGRVRRDWRWLRWLLVAPIAVALAAILRARANAFYTESALIDGMTALFTLRIAVTVLRRRALRRIGLASADHRAPYWRRHGAEWRRIARARSLFTTPGVRFADALTVLVGWLLLATWTLIAFAHRHPAGPLLLLAGAIELLTLFALVPDALAGSGALADRRPYGAWPGGDARAAEPARHDSPHSPSRTFPMLRRDP